jgi:glycosyltransferase involved in cell wall biosynthesis
MVPHKQPDVALKIFGEMFKQCSDFSLVMVGSGLNDLPAYAETFYAALEALSLDAQERVIMFEGIDDSALRALYLRADVFLCTSAHEGFCVPLYEAMSFGLPISALQQPAVIETLNGAGYILSECIADAASQLAALMDDQIALDALVIKAKKRGHELRESANGEQIWQVLNEVLRSGGRHNAYQ